MTELEIVEVTDRNGALVAQEWLLLAEPVHRQLRPQLPPDYLGAMQRVFAGGGRMLVAHSGDEVCGVAVWRAFENTFAGLFFYVDDLVTDAARRSSGVGKALLTHCEGIARELGCREFTLDSGVQRAQAHKFYFREGLTIASYKFAKPLVP
jgi:GNAT superfamily N-acetyltransferase